MVQLEDIKILIEVKNYASSIPTKEIEKFLNDVNTTPCDCALFIAFDQRITGKSRISIESTSTCK